MIITMSMRLTKSKLKLTAPNQNTINGNLKSSQNDVEDDLHDTNNDDMEVEMTYLLTNYKEYLDYVEPVETKQSDDITEDEDEDNVDVNTKLINYGLVSKFS